MQSTTFKVFVLGTFVALAGSMAQAQTAKIHPDGALDTQRTLASAKHGPNDPAVAGVNKAADLASPPGSQMTAWDIFVRSSEVVYWNTAADTMEARSRYIDAANKAGGNPNANPGNMDFERLIKELEKKGFSRQDGNANNRRTPAPVVVRPQTEQPLPIGSGERGGAGGATGGGDLVAKTTTPAWSKVLVARDGQGKRYVELEKDGQIKRVTSGGTIDGWKITVSPDGEVNASKGGARVVL